MTNCTAADAGLLHFWQTNEYALFFGIVSRAIITGYSSPPLPFSLTTATLDVMIYLMRHILKLTNIIWVLVT